MEVRSRQLVFVGLLLAAWFCTADALAWTDSRVRSARVVVQLDPAAQAWVLVDLTVQVRGGWLEGFEVNGLDPDAALDRLKPPVLVAEDGRKWAPRARIRRGGRLLLAFPGRGSPRRGRYRLTFAYHTSLAHRATEPQPGEHTRITWTLPAWENGLEDVEVWVWAPSARAQPVDEPGLSKSRKRRLADRTLLRFHRMHLPRATAWPVALDVPDRALDEELVVARDQEDLGEQPFAGGRRRRQSSGVPVVIWLATLGLFAWWQVAWECRSGRHVRFWLGSRTRGLLASGLALALLGWRPQWTDVGLPVALLAGAAWTARATTGPRFGHWVRLGREQRSAARVGAFLDVLGRPQGADPVSCLGLGLPLAALVARAHLFEQPVDLLRGVAGVLGLAVVWSNRRWGMDQATSWRRLFDLAADIRLSGVGLGVRAFRLACGRFVQPRLSVVPAARISGLLRLEVSLDERPRAGTFVVMATVVPGGLTDRWLSELGGTRQVSPGGRRACHLFVVDDASAVQRELSLLLDHCHQRALRLVAVAA